IEQDAGSQSPARQKVKPAAQGIWDRLSLEVIAECGEIAPAIVAAKFDERRANHDAKDEPAKEPNDDDGRFAFRKRTTIEQRAKEDREEAGFEQLNFPPVTVPILSDMDDRHVERPKRCHDDRIGVTSDDNARESEADPRSRLQKNVRM